MRGAEPLAPALRALVRQAEAALGETAAEAEGRAFFGSVERARRLMAGLRDAGPAGRARALARADRLLRGLAPERRALFARAYTVYLELVNACENAYRTHRLRGRAAAPRGRGADAVFVLTAHPTESRSPDNIRLMRRVQALLLDALERGRPPDAGALKSLLRLVWRTGTHPPHKPKVEDEARHLFSLLDDAVLAELLELGLEGHRLRLRTWVGGDRDGHPGVGPEQTSASLGLSRERMLGFIRGRLLGPLREDLALAGAAGASRALRAFEASLGRVALLRPGDGGRLAALHGRLRRLESASRGLGPRHPSLARLALLLDLFPGLVVPLELREARGSFTPGSPIAAMMSRLKALARGGRIDWYARGCVVSLVREPRDILQAVALVQKVLGAPALPVIPLFETPEVLPRAAGILAAAHRDPRFRRALGARRGRLEVMLGYSDTAKRMGSFPSRLALGRAMRAIGLWCRLEGVAVVFFQGAGGSEGRGGGTVEEQAATWPKEALHLVKLTVQGEMVERTFASPAILRSQVEKIARIQASPPAYRPPSPIALELSREASASFAAYAADPDLRGLLEAATPYARLGTLTIGSRPASRPAAGGGLEGLRAIPWVFCWTQVRYLLPVWLGIGSAWRVLRRRPGAARRLRAALDKDPLLRSFTRLLGFALAKTEPDLWAHYARRLAPGRFTQLLRRLEAERRDALDLARAASPGRKPLSDRAWLAESIRYRAPMIHPLNLLQAAVLEKRTWGPGDERLFRETVTGIAAGMLTTG